MYDWNLKRALDRANNPAHRDSAFKTQEETEVEEIRHYSQDNTDLGYRIYYSFLPLNYERPGGIWWDVFFQDYDAAQMYIRDIVQICAAVRVSREWYFESEADLRYFQSKLVIEPPLDAEVIK
jgi:hypothetical protein